MIPQKVNEFKESFKKQASINKKIVNYSIENNNRRILTSKFVSTSEFCKSFLGKSLAIENPIKNEKLNQFKVSLKHSLRA